MQDKLKDELADVQQSLAFEKEERGATLAQVETLRKEVAHLSSELEAATAAGWQLTSERLPSRTDAEGWILKVTSLARNA